MAALLLRSSDVQYQTDRSLLRFEFEKRGGPINQPSPVPLHRINSCGRPSESTVALTARPGFPLWTTLFTHSLLSPTNLLRRSKTWHRETDSLRPTIVTLFTFLRIINYRGREIDRVTRNSSMGLREPPVSLPIVLWRCTREGLDGAHRGR